MRSGSSIAVAMAVLVCFPAPAFAIAIQFDYRYDTGGFFTNDVKTVLNAAAASFTMFTDKLSAINPAGANVWKAEFTNPTTGNADSLENLTIAADTILIFAGARDLADAALGIGQKGGFQTGGAQALQDTVAARGQAGALANPVSDFGPWGGSISFDTKNAKGENRNWNFSVKDGPGAGQDDFLYVAIHELAHVLGFGTSDSWERYVDDKTEEFTGPASKAASGGNNPDLQTKDLGHWSAIIVKSTLPGTKTEQLPAMVPEADQTGKRLLFTRLDYAGMKDVGWEVPDALLAAPVPEPATLALFGVALAAAAMSRRGSRLLRRVRR